MTYSTYYLFYALVTDKYMQNNKMYLLETEGPIIKENSSQANILVIKKS